jgi:hypothetical protein
MDLVDLIEKRRFVGREFLVWMWFESELCDGLLGVEGFGTCEIRLEGHEALRQGKLPTQARVRVSAGELEYAFLFGADTLALSAIKIPNVVKEEGDEQFYERMYLVEELEALFAALYGQFLALRLSTAWDEQVLPAIRAWVRGDELIHPDVYRKMRARVAPLGSTRRPATVPPPAEEMKMEEPALKIA